LRIVGGKYRGRALLSPKGDATRPTSDRARQAIFNILEHAAWMSDDIMDSGVVLDIFAGTGALGLEALSRGKSMAVFFEQNKSSASICHANAEKMGALDDTRIFRCDATKPPKRPNDIPPATLVFLDPPYGKDLGLAAIEAFIAKDWLAENAIIIMEMAVRTPEPLPDSCEQIDSRDYGVAHIRFLKRKIATI